MAVAATCLVTGYLVGAQDRSSPSSGADIAAYTATDAEALLTELVALETPSEARSRLVDGGISPALEDDIRLLLSSSAAPLMGQVDTWRPLGPNHAYVKFQLIAESGEEVPPLRGRAIMCICGGGRGLQLDAIDFCAMIRDFGLTCESVTTP